MILLRPISPPWQTSPNSATPHKSLSLQPQQTPHQLLGWPHCILHIGWKYEDGWMIKGTGEPLAQLMVINQNQFWTFEPLKLIDGVSGQYKNSIQKICFYFRGVFRKLKGETCYPTQSLPSSNICQCFASLSTINELAFVWLSMFSFISNGQCRSWNWQDATAMASVQWRVSAIWALNKKPVVNAAFIRNCCLQLFMGNLLLLSGCLQILLGIEAL